MLKFSLDTLLAMQNNRCFLCGADLPREKAAITSLVDERHGPENYHDNTVACCKPAKAMFDKLSMRKKIQAILSSQIKGKIFCTTPQESSAKKQNA